MTTQRAPYGFLGKRGLVWALLASWLVPAMMAGAYVVLMATSETDTSGKLWEAGGLGFVLFLWVLFRILTHQAAMTRAIAVGDAERILELARGRSAPVERALAHELRGEWQRALAALRSAPPHDPLAATVRVGVLVETGEVAAARATWNAELATRPRDPEVAIRARLAEARLRWAEGDPAGSARLCDALVDDIRAGASIRAVAHFYASRCTSDATAITRHRAKAAELAPGSWVAR